MHATYRHIDFVCIWGKICRLKIGYCTSIPSLCEFFNTQGQAHPMKPYFRCEFQILTHTNETICLWIQWYSLWCWWYCCSSGMDRFYVKGDGMLSVNWIWQRHECLSGADIEYDYLDTTSVLWTTIDSSATEKQDMQLCCRYLLAKFCWFLTISENLQHKFSRSRSSIKVLLNQSWKKLNFWLRVTLLQDMLNSCRTCISVLWVELDLTMMTSLKRCNSIRIKCCIIELLCSKTGYITSTPTMQQEMQHSCTHSKAQFQQF